MGGDGGDTFSLASPERQEEIRQRISKSFDWTNPEYQARRSAAMRGKKQSIEHIEKRTAPLRGRRPSDACMKACAETRWKRRKLSLAQEHQVVERYASGMSGVQLGAVYGLCEGTIYDIIRRHGEKVRKASQYSAKLSEYQKNEIISLYGGGTSSTVLAKKYGVANQTIVALLHQRGCKVRHRGGRVPRYTN